jgi:uncharacterized protein (DUF302 family)
LHTFNIVGLPDKAVDESKDRVSSAIKNSGFSIADDRDMNEPFLKQFESTSFDIYHTITVYDVANLHKTLQIEPKVGAFVPFTVLLYSKKGSKESYIAFIKPKTVMNAINNDNKKLYDSLNSSFEKLYKEIKKIDKSIVDYKLGYDSKYTKSKDLLFIKEYNLKPTDKPDIKKEEIQFALESALDVSGFKLANISKLTNDFEQIKLDNGGFDFFETYSICKLKVIFSTSKDRPESGVFAPCSVFFYKKKNENKIVVGMPPTLNWTEITSVTDKSMIDIMQEAENSVKNALNEVE